MTWKHQLWISEETVTIPVDGNQIIVTKAEALKIAFCILMSANRQNWIDENTLHKLQHVIDRK